MFWASRWRLTIGVKRLCFAGCAIAQLHGKRRQECMYGQTNGQENEKFTTVGIPLVVTHPSTKPAQQGLTSVIGPEPFFFVLNRLKGALFTN